MEVKREKETEIAMRARRKRRRIWKAKWKGRWEEDGERGRNRCREGDDGGEEKQKDMKVEGAKWRSRRRGGQLR